ncbi:hypothetical protein GCM10027449_13000 [Sinomonas notoginsengisoli]|uniref:DUF485 domain-containing protein n=1 Tax=Sinomonas notoginsengisoli TaxID=1457311 RepID=UPI001F3FE19C|nr:DUF485 domain-containing protein [Sinomonas notoginsengisoli]
MANDASRDATAASAAHPDFQLVQASEEFRELRKSHRSFVFPIAGAFLLWYFLYVLLADYAHDFMSIKLFGNITVGLVLGLLQFVSTFGITAWYVHHANKNLDPAAEAIRGEIEQHDFDGAASRRDADGSAR